MFSGFGCVWHFNAHCVEAVLVPSRPRFSLARLTVRPPFLLRPALFALWCFLAVRRGSCCRACRWPLAFWSVAFLLVYSLLLPVACLLVLLLSRVPSGWSGCPMLSRSVLGVFACGSSRSPSGCYLAHSSHCPPLSCPVLSPLRWHPFSHHSPLWCPGYFPRDLASASCSLRLPPRCASRCLIEHHFTLALFFLPRLFGLCPGPVVCPLALRTARFPRFGWASNSAAAVLHALSLLSLSGIFPVSVLGRFLACTISLVA